MRVLAKVYGILAFRSSLWTSSDDCRRPRNVKYYKVYMDSDAQPVFLSTPSAELRILDLGSTRRIFVNGLAIHNGRRQKVLDTVETPLTVETIELLVKLKGDWWLDELERRSDQSYVQKRLTGLIGRFETLEGKRVLDIGSGSGSSALALINGGASYVQGVEPNAHFVDLADRRAQDEGLADKASFLHLTDTTKLPFDDGRFDIVTFNAVLEHVDPKLRAPILQEAFRCLKSGGLLVVAETPNKVFPYDGHTTLLPLVPWLPFNWAVAIAKKFSRNSPRGLTKEQYISEGIVGANYWKIKKTLPNAQCLNLTDGDAKWKTSLRTTYRVLRTTLRIMESVLRIFDVPLTAIMPVLDLVLRKK